MAKKVKSALAETAAGKPDPSEYGLVIERTLLGGSRVVFAQYDQVIMRGASDQELDAFFDLLIQERDRMKEEILDDIRRGDIDPNAVQQFDDLFGEVDANIYASGGRSVEGAYGDEIHGWSDIKTAEHAKRLVSLGVSKGVRDKHAEELVNHQSLVGFCNAVTKGVDAWIMSGGLEERAAPQP
jgi:hypothetical protein